MYREGYILTSDSDYHFLRDAFGIYRKRSSKCDVELGEYRILIVTPYENDSSASLKSSSNQIHGRFLNDSLIINKYETDYSVEKDDKVAIVIYKKNNDYYFKGFYVNNEVGDNHRYYRYSDFKKYDKVFFCYPKFLKGTGYITSIQYDSYRYDNTSNKEYIAREEHFIGKNELNTSDYIYENMKLLAMHHAVDKKLNQCPPKFLDYSELEDMLFRLAYSKIDSQVINGDSNELQQQILRESSRIVNEFIEYMGE